MNNIKVHIASKEERIHGLRNSIAALRRNLTDITSGEPAGIAKRAQIRATISEYEVKIKVLENEEATMVSVNEI